jgi:hypothetical protein
MSILPNSGEYVYRYKGTDIGWQLDLSAGALLPYRSSTVNYIPGSNSEFLGSLWAGKITHIDLKQPSSSREKTILDCSIGNIYVGEPTGKVNKFYFIATTLPAGSAVGLADGVYIHDIYYAYDSTPSPTPTPSPSPPSFNPGDLNQDGKVNIFDYNILVTDFGKTGSPGFIPADIDKNGKVDIFDYNELVENFGL